MGGERGANEWNPVCPGQRLFTFEPEVVKCCNKHHYDFIATQSPGSPWALVG